MTIHMLLRMAFRSLSHHIMRSLLTMLGVIIGIVAIVAIQSVGQGAKEKVAAEINSLGSNCIIVLAGSENKTSRGSQNALTLKKDEFEAVVSEAEYISHASPGVMSSVETVYEGRNWKTFIVGVSDTYPIIRTWPVIKGTFFSNQDVVSAQRVAVLGLTVARELFGDEAEVVGKRIRINKKLFTVLGVMAEKGKRPDGRDEDDMIFTPWTTVHKKIMGITDGFGAFIISAQSKEATPKAYREVKSILTQKKYRSTATDREFTIFTQDEIARALDAATAALNLLLLAVASIALFVGGIGIMNIMLVTVAERTKEIGIRMALGASTYAILTQFLFEAVIICLVGGLLGVGIGIFLAFSAGSLLGWSVAVSALSILAALVTCVVIGIFFGFYPAFKASRLTPVEALTDH